MDLVRYKCTSNADNLKESVSMKAKKVISKVLAAALASAMLLSCVYAASPDRTMSSAAQSNGNFSASATTNGKKPKYVFLFIGDGMSYPQFQAAIDQLHDSSPEYVGALLSVFSEARATVESEIESMLNGNETSDEAVANMAETINSSIEEYSLVNE